MTNRCGTCNHYTPDQPDETAAPSRTMPGFGKCDLLPADQVVSAWPWGCRLDPSQYEGPDKNPHQQMVEGGHAIGIVKDGKLIAVDAEVYVDPKDDPPPLELT